MKKFKVRKEVVNTFCEKLYHELKTNDYKEGLKEAKEKGKYKLLIRGLLLEVQEDIFCIFKQHEVYEKQLKRIEEIYKSL